MDLIHEFWGKYDKSNILSHANTFAEFKVRLEAFAKKNAFDDKEHNDILGDGFEAFGEAYIKIFRSVCVKMPCEELLKFIPILEYTPKHGYECGVDGYGVNHTDNAVVFQFKFRSDSSTKLTGNQDHVDRVVTEAWSPLYNIKNTHTDRIILFTNCKGMHRETEKGVCRGVVSTVNLEEIENKVDNALLFWRKFKIYADIAAT